jgi:cAMP phosphodiesterase
VRTFPLNHGHNDSGSYESVAFFIRDEPTGKQFLFFGDVEPDSLNLHPKTIDVWRAAAPLIPETLSAIFIECSYPSGRPVDQLYGHLTPEYLVQELVVLAKEVRKAKPIGHASDQHTRHTRKRQKRQLETTRALEGLTVYVTHCKDSGETERPVSEVIVEQVRALAEKEGLGVTIRAAEQGMRIRKWDITPPCTLSR